MVVQETSDEAGEKQRGQSDAAQTKVERKLEADGRIPGADAVPDLEVDRAAIEKNVGGKTGEGEAEPATEENGTRKGGSVEERRKEAEEARRCFELGHFVLNLDERGGGWLVIVRVVGGR